MTKLLVFSPVPQDAEPVGDNINVFKVVSKTRVFGQVGGVTGEIEAGKCQSSLNSSSVPSLKMWPPY